MWLIDRDTNGCSGSRIPLPPALRQALVSWYIGKGSFHDENAGITLVQNARIGLKWLACDCLGPSAPPPILTPAFLSEAETYYLRRLTGSHRPEHKEACPFFRDQATNRITEVRNRSTPADPPSGFFEVLKPAPENLSQRPEEDVTDDRTRNASVPRMARLLWRLLDTAGVNTVAPISAGEERSIKAGFSAIGYAAGRIEIAPGIELARAFWSHHRPLQTNAIYATLRRMGREWPRDHAPQGFVLMYAKAIRGCDIQVADGELITIANRVQSPSVRGNRIEGPYLVLVVVGQYPEAHGLAPLRGYAQPIYNGQMFVPVDSNFEREVLRELLRCQRTLDASGIDLAIDKPVFDRLTPGGSCRPDFLIEARSRMTGEIRTIVIEAMGLNDEAYHASKAVTHPRMRHLGELISIAPEDVANGYIAMRLKQALDL